MIEPGMLPIPPRTTTMNDLMPKAMPIVGVTGMKGEMSAPKRPRIAQPRPKVTA
jgi:hypothetical protein